MALFDGTPKRYKIVHAANVLVDLKKQFHTIIESKHGHQNKLFTCILQSLGAVEIYELAQNWATMSRYKIIKAVGSIAKKRLGWFGAIVAVGEFIDCMWG